MRYDENAANWEYRGEGNFHIIIAHKEDKVVLRLPKRYKEPHERKSDLLIAETAAKSEISFQKHIIFPLLRNCRACFASNLVKLNPKFLCEIVAKIRDKRPPNRSHKEIDISCVHGVLLPDFAHVLPRPPYPPNGSCSICVEIKPKKGFLNSNGNCSYCSKQFLKLKKGSCTKISSYCPLDLFSGDYSRMKTALMSLIRSPQNNLRVFQNGGLVFSEELCNSYHGSNLELFTNAVLSLFSSSVERKMPAFIESVCNILTHQLVDISSVNHTGCKCPMKMYKNGTYTVCDNKENENAEQCMTNGCILDLILRIQKLEQCSLDEYCKMYHKVSDSNLLNLLEQPFNGKNWQNLMNHLTDDDKPQEQNHHDILTNYVQLLQKFLIATSLKDCSILITLQEKHDDELLSIQDNEAFPIFLDNGKGPSFWCSLAIIDCDPKPVSRIPTYAKLDAEILKSFHSFVQSIND